MEGKDNPSYKSGDSDSWPEDDRRPEPDGDSSAVAVEMGQKKEKSAGIDDIDAIGLLDDTDGKRYTPQEEKILKMLREIVRKCTNPDPMKRPTAAEVLELLNACPMDVK